MYGNGGATGPGWPGDNDRDDPAAALDAVAAAQASMEGRIAAGVGDLVTGPARPVNVALAFAVGLILVGVASRGFVASGLATIVALVAVLVIGRRFRNTVGVVRRGAVTTRRFIRTVVVGIAGMLVYTQVSSGPNGLSHCIELSPVAAAIGYWVSAWDARRPVPTACLPEERG